MNIGGIGFWVVGDPRRLRPEPSWVWNFGSCATSGHEREIHLATTLLRVKLAAGPPSHWRITLTDGSVVDVWAESVEGLSGPEDQRDYHFGNLMDIAPDKQSGFEIAARTPETPDRVLVTVARFPRGCVKRLEMAM